MSSTNEQTVERRVRRKAERVGLALRKPRNGSGYFLVNLSTNGLDFPFTDVGGGADLDVIEEYLDNE